VARLLEIATRGALRLVSYRFVAQPVPQDGETAPARAGAIELRRLQADDPLVTQLPRPPAVIARRFRDGAHCLAAIKGERLVGFLWFKESEYVEDEVRCCYRFDPTAAVWDFDVYIDPEFRLGRLFARLWDFANRELRARGYRWTLSRISAFNPASLAAHARLGARRIGSAVFVVAGPLQVSFASFAPYVHLGWRDDMYPVFVLNPE
jgi:GNAT superfamily N-acetyltransferase